MRALLAVHAAQRSQLHAALGQRGWRIASVGTASEVIGRLRTGAFQMVVISSQLPDSDGPSLCRAIRSSSHGRAAYLVMVHPTTVPEAVRAMVDAGIDDLIATPVAPSYLAMRLAFAEFRLGPLLDEVDGGVAPQRAAPRPLQLAAAVPG